MSLLLVPTFQMQHTLDFPLAFKSQFTFSSRKVFVWSNQRRPGNTQPAPGATHHEPIGHGPHPHINQQPSTEDIELSPMVCEPNSLFLSLFLQIRRDRLAPHFPDARTGVTALFCTHPSLDTSTRRHGRGRSHHAPTTEDADTDITLLLCRVVLRQATVVENAGKSFGLKNTDKQDAALFTPPFCPDAHFRFLCFRRALFPGGMEDLVKTLAEVSVRQQHCFELLTEQHGHIQGYLTDLRLSAAQNVPLPDARVTAGRLLPKLTADDDIEAYLKMFESVANTEGWARGTWAAVLAPLLSGEAQRAYFSLPVFMETPARYILICLPSIKDLPVPLLLGRDWPGFEAALADATQPAQPRRRQLRAPMLTSDSGRDGESPPPDSNLFFDVFQQVTGGGDFGKAQKEDDRLKHCWGQEVFPAPHPLPHFVVQNGLLYCVAERRGEGKTETVLELAHSHPMAGHLGVQNTTQRIRDRFHWPGLEAEVKSFCQACPRKPPPSPLIPLPIIGVPFERIGMDIVGPLPRSGRGHEHILVIVDYATRHQQSHRPRVGLPSEILTDQGTPFMSRLMADLCRLLKVKQRFNQTLKQMLRRVTTEDKKDWDLLLPYVLFGVREVPQASTGFTPFELLFGRQPRGLLDVAREAWEQQPAAYRTVIEHVKEMRAKIDQVMPLVREHLVKAQQAQQRLYNRAAQPREFQPGDRDQVAALTLQEPAVLDTNPDLSAAQKADLRHLVGQFLDVFSDNPGQTNVLSHDIRTPPGVIVRQRPYRVPEARRQAIEAEIQKMLKLGVIEPSRSPWSSPIVLVPKPDGTLRFCNDYRRLNEVSDFDSYPMPRVDELLERLGRARYITTLDLTKGYWQVPLSEEAKPKTAFSTPSGHWQYRTLPFGLHGAPATFQRLMDIILRPHQTYAAAYLDDLVIHSEAWEDHLERLRRVLSELRRAGLTANPRKCHLALHEARYLGFTVGRGLIKPQENKVKAILEAPKPSTKTQVRAFLGLAGYYRCFIPSFSSIAAPLTDLTRKGQPDRIRWTEEAEHAFRIIRGALTTEPVLRAPDFSCPFLLHTDASDTGLGAVLSQVQEGEEHPVVYISRKLSKAERNYAAVEKEALAIKWAVLELRYYLLGRRFTLFTDHAPLQWMARAKDTNARVTRWFLSLQDFHFDVRHRAGSSNTNADGLSRSWAAYTGLSGVTPLPPPVSPFVSTSRTRTSLREGDNQRRPGNTQPAPGATHHEPIGHGPHPHINQQPSTEDRELSPMVCEPNSLFLSLFLQIRRDRLAPHFPDARTGVTALFCTHPSLDTSTRRHGRGRSHHAPTTEDADTDITRICFLTCSILQ
ncbi:hypothetical protein M9458_030628 [Cirrhinus mrigala]|uniref:Gypsy retrotransposon integrase-like protein 1 n=1 Tax=Cirrhinus mrigala TaxID=683832 RepID=A0ABD0PKU9_CIRMR